MSAAKMAKGMGEVKLLEFKQKLLDRHTKPKTDIVPAYIDRKAKKIIIDRDLLKQKFDDQAWTKPKVKGVKPLEKDQFKTYEEWERFLIEHEKAHAINPKRKNESKADYENRINEIAL